MSSGVGLGDFFLSVPRASGSGISSDMCTISVTGVGRSKNTSVKVAMRPCLRSGIECLRSSGQRIGCDGENKVASAGEARGEARVGRAHADAARFCYLPQSRLDVGAVAVEIAALVASPCAKAFTGCGSHCRTCWSSGPMCCRPVWSTRPPSSAGSSINEGRRRLPISSPTAHAAQRLTNLPAGAGSCPKTLATAPPPAT